MKKSLLDTNPYLRDPEKRWEYFKTSVSSSSAIEGIHIPKELSQAVLESMKKEDKMSRIEFTDPS